MRKLFLVSIILFFVLAVIPTQKTKAAVDCATSQIIAVTLEVAADAVCQSGTAEECSRAVQDASLARVRSQLICHRGY